MKVSRIGVIGLGAMGMGVARSLLRAGFEVHACDLRAELRDAIAAAGVAVALRFFGLYFAAVERGESQLAWVAPEHAAATGLLVRGGLVVIVLVLSLRGKSLRVGQIVMTGTLTPILPIVRGSTYEATYATLGKVVHTFR